jgi:hypothetical protein
MVAGAVEAATSATAVGTAGTLVLTSPASSPASNTLGIAYKNAIEYTPTNNTPISHAVWASTGSGQATMTTVAAHGLVVGDEFIVNNMEPSGFDQLVRCIAGTAGSTLVLNKIDALGGSVVAFADPGTLSIAAATWAVDSLYTGVITFTTGASHDMAPGVYITVSNANPSTYNGTYLTLANTSGTTIKVAKVADPGAYVGSATWVGGGNIATNGAHGFGRKNGLNTTLFGATRHYSGRGGQPLFRQFLHQAVEIDVYASTGKLSSALAELGMSFELVHQYADSACLADTSDQTITNLGTGGAANDYLRGSTDPTVEGTPSTTPDRDTGLSFDGGDFCAPAGTPSVLATAHNANGEFTIFVCGQTPATYPVTQYVISTSLGQTASADAGINFRITTNGKSGLIVRDDGNLSVFALNSVNALPASTRFVMACSVKDLSGTIDRSYTSWLYDTANPDCAEAIALYSAPSVLAAQSLAYIGKNGAAGTEELTSGFKITAVLVSDTFMTKEAALPLIRTLTRWNNDDIN